MSKEALNSILLDVKKDPIRLTGICKNVEIICAEAGLSNYTYDRIISLLEALIQQWPDSRDASGDFPVEGDFNTYFSYSDKWDPNQLYGQRRIQLLNWLIQQTS